MGAPLFAPFQGWLVRPQWAEQVAAAAYDSMSAEQRRIFVEKNPYSYLGITRSREDLLDGCSEADLLQFCITAFQRLIEVEAFVQSAQPTYYAYRLSSANSSSTAHPNDRVFDQLGIVGALDVDGLRDGRVLTHENIRAERASLITEHLSQVGASSSPIALTHVAAPEFTEILASVVKRIPEVDVLVDGIRNQVWGLNERETDNIQPLLSDTKVFVTDGHHRCAASLAARDAHLNERAYARTLAVLFPHDQLVVEAFHRRVPNQAERSFEALLRDLRHLGTVTELPGDTALLPQPSARGEVVVYLQKRWLQLVFDPVAQSTPLQALDVERVRCEIIGAVLGVDETAGNSVDYIPQPVGVAELVRRCDLDGYVGLVLYPTDINDLMAVAAAGELMPPKSSYLNPKPPSGVFLRTLGVGATKNLAAS
ncbi:MAG: DUF1015 family protein [Acidimicrobiia bacterium]|nr:DUF1015 family protein [Acidimicrobiia bacterium]MCY4458409.1 DUF1015 family protein [Acidimicrobiaceae bacterium]